VRIRRAGPRKRLSAASAGHWAFSSRGCPEGSGPGCLSWARVRVRSPPDGGAESRGSARSMNCWSLSTPPLIRWLVAALLVRRMWLRQLTAGNSPACGCHRALRLARDFHKALSTPWRGKGLARSRIWHDLAFRAARGRRAVALGPSQRLPATLSYALAAKIMACCLEPRPGPMTGRPPLPCGRLKSAARSAPGLHAFLHAPVMDPPRPVRHVSRTGSDRATGPRNSRPLGARTRYIAWAGRVLRRGQLAVAWATG